MHGGRVTAKMGKTKAMTGEEWNKLRSDVVSRWYAKLQFLQDILESSLETGSAWSLSLR